MIGELFCEVAVAQTARHAAEHTADIAGAASLQQQITDDQQQNGSAAACRSSTLSAAGAAGSLTGITVLRADRTCSESVAAAMNAGAAARYVFFSASRAILIHTFYPPVSKILILFYMMNVDLSSILQKFCEILRLFDWNQVRTVSVLPLSVLLMTICEGIASRSSATCEMTPIRREPSASFESICSARESKFSSSEPNPSSMNIASSRMPPLCA